MTINAGDIKSFTLITGMEIIGKVAAVHEEYFEITEAFGVQVEQRVNEQNQPVGVEVGMRPLTSFAMQESRTGGMDIELYYSTLLLSTNPPEGVIMNYAQLTGAIIAPPEKKIVAPV